jgi:poly-beta-1,6-N-acetyl-D-glucosamine synthase
MSENTNYVVITPARDEAQHIEKTIASVAAQTVRPSEWIIVDDGSRDQTPALAEAWAAREPWISVFRRPDRGSRQAGGGVMQAFYDGYARLRGTSWEYVVKLDGDLSFEPEYFARCFERFRSEPRLGIAGGMICHLVGGALVPEGEADQPFHVRGATKIYRRACWDAIGPLFPAPGWDTLDELKANMLGWTTRMLPELRLTHHRPTGAADGSWKNWVKNGKANYITGYHPLFMLVKCCRRLLRRPALTGSLGLAYGYLAGFFGRVPQVPDPPLIAYVRRQQLRRLFFMPSLWR